MMDFYQLKNLIIEPTLKDLILFSEEAVQLLLFTCANESLGGSYLKQINGPALGIYQMEPNTYNDIWQNYIYNKNDLKLIFIHSFNAPIMPSEERLVYDLRFSTAMARIHYHRYSFALPRLNNVEELWCCYKKYYNTNLGKADYHEAISNYNKFISKS